VGHLGVRREGRCRAELRWLAWGCERLLVAEALEPGGRVFFFDDNHRTQTELIEGVNSAVVQRRLNDGTPFRVITIPYEPADLEQRLRDLHWDISVTGTSGPFYWGAGGR
jgi:hypothetical protein